MPRNGKNDKPHLSIARRPETDTKRVSLRSVVNKGSENIIRRQMVDFLPGRNYPSERQHCVRERSCITNFLDFYERVSSVLDKRKPGWIIFIWMPESI